MARSGFPYTPFPNGWFRVVDSDELQPGTVRALEYFGKRLVVFRGEDGIAHVLDAYCAHLGAHLGVGGEVVGNTIKCPFHAWRYDGDGNCVEVPYARKIPPRAKVHAWTMCEKNGMILVWHHAEGKPPSFEIPDVPEWGSQEWSPPQRRSFKVRAHCQEMAENVVDDAHFKFVHQVRSMPQSTAEIDGHIFRVVSISKVGTPRGETEGRIEIASHGLGFGLTRFTGVVEMLVVISGAPIDEEYSETTLRFMVKKLANEEATRGVGKAFIAEIERQFGQDIPIWENKIHLTRPALCDGDGPIALLRKWARQFYSETPAEPALERPGQDPL